MSIHLIRLVTGKSAYRVKIRTADGGQYSQTFRTQKEAEAFEIRERAALQSGASVDPWAGQITFRDYADSWIDLRVGLRPKTLELYHYLLDHHLLPSLGPVEIRTISPAWVRAWNSQLAKRPTIGPSTRAKAYRLLRTMMTTAVEDELIAKNPCVLKKASVERPDERPIASVEQLNAIIAVLDDRYRAMILITAWCGLRWGEIAGLARSDIDLRARTVRVRRQLPELSNGTLAFRPPKTAAGTRTVSIPPHIVTYCRAPRHLRRRR